MDETMAPSTARHDLIKLLGTVDGAMTKSLVALSPEAPVSIALAIFQEHGVGGAPVVHGGRVVGVVTVTDLVSRRISAQHTGPFLRPHHEARDWIVADEMTETAVVASPGEPLVDAVLRMCEARVGRLPVVDPDGRPIGILARDDVVRAVARAAQHGGTGGTERRALLLPDRPFEAEGLGGSSQSRGSRVPTAHRSAAFGPTTRGPSARVTSGAAP